MHEKEQKKKDIENTYDQAKKNYKKNIIDPWESDKAFAMGMNLWIYFLADPKKVIDSIKEVQKKAALRGNSSFNALNINLTKHWLHASSNVSFQKYFYWFIFWSVRSNLFSVTSSKVDVKSCLSYKNILFYSC